ncbi:hypothetical protein C2G38_2096336 [Gigaspora rosea]|uniref:Uncharacterized protein n=1 Tax=Gigaspora rosea TaxID=44941 RepID=A0A397UVH8_9GLOM|nr:hypothetical protein C2G38_2096336 [Gigaspora rosea]
MPQFCRSLHNFLAVDDDIIKFWKELSNAKVAFVIPQDIEESEIEALNRYSTIKDNQIYLNQGVIANLEAR